MNTKIKSVITAASLLALSALTSHAQLLLNSTTSTFSNITGAGVASPSTVTNTQGNATQPVGSINFGSGNLVVQTFAAPTSPVTQPPTSSVGGNFFGTNGVVTLGTQYSIDAWFINRNTNTQFTGGFDFNLGLDFGPAAGTDLNLGFHMGLVPSGGTGEGYAITMLPGTALTGTFNVGTTLYAYELFPTGLTAASIGTNSNGLATIDAVFSLVTVPEPSTYALFGAVALVGMVAVRRIRSTKKVA